MFFASYMDPVRLPVLMTLLFGGHYSEIPKDIIHSFSVTGIIHILSVSGSHIALLFGFLYFLGKWLGLSMKVTVVPAVLLVLVYAAMSGFVPPVIRASLMGILAVIGVLLERGGRRLIFWERQWRGCSCGTPISFLISASSFPSARRQEYCFL